MTDAVRSVQDRVWVDRLESTIESHILPVAQVRETCTIPGTSLRTAYLCRDKPSMKDALRAAGVPTAASTAADNAEQVQQFAMAVGFPLILKPRSGAGAADTTRVDDQAQLGQALASFGAKGVDSIAVEEFVEGHEGFYDTLSIDGSAAADFVCHYFPNVLEAMRNRWISPQFISTNQVESVEDYQQLREMGQRVVEALGIGTSATHMEWFFGPKGLKFSEIGCRPPGVGAWDLYSAGNDLDLYLRVGERDRARHRVEPTVAPVRQRDHRPAARARRTHQRILRGGGDPGALRRVGPRRPSARPRDTDPVARGRLHGQRLCPDAAPGLRRSPADARRRGPDHHRACRVSPRITLLGPQPRSNLQRAFADLDPESTVAVVTAGWQEREVDDAELREHVGPRTVNLSLHARLLSVYDEDREYAHAEREHEAALAEVRQLYLVQLDHALSAAYDVARRSEARPRLRERALTDALRVVQLLDEQHMQRVKELHEAFYDAWRPQERDSVARHREEVRHALEGSSALAIAGGHVGELARVLHLFHVAPHLPARVVAWSAGAMALTERVVLFHDFVPHGVAQTEVYGTGIGVVTGLVALPHARRRLRVGDQIRMSVLARRFAPARCLVLDDVTSVSLGEDGGLPPEARVLDHDGHIATLEAA